MEPVHKLCIDEILADLVTYLHPNLLQEEYQGLLDISKTKKENLKKYYQLISNIRYVFQKTLKYHYYFAEFYPPC